MEILTTHVGADFDAFAAMMVARRFHPEARLFFPGSREGSVRRMIEARGLEVPEIRQKEVDPAALTRVVLCDIRQRSRIGIVASWLEANPGIEVWAYDHHSAAPGDVAVTGGIVDPEAGSSSTLLVEELRRQGHAVSAGEADLLLLGIYEDTGSLTYITTGPRDLAAAAWLLEQGGDLAAVRASVSRPLDPERLDVLHHMTQRLEIHRIRGHRVGIVEVELGRYVEELAPLVSRCLEIFSLPLLFAAFGEGERVALIARGTLEDFDLGEALKELAGGGGHATAASARLKDTTLLEIRERLLAYLHRALPPAARARDLMIAPFHVISAGTTVEEAKGALNARRINAAPVEREGRIVGTVSRQILDAALQHGLGPRPVETVMTPDLAWVAPDAPADEVRECMLRRHPRFVLVGDPAAGLPLGLVTRMQLLRHLHGQLANFEERFDRRAEQQGERREGIGKLMARRLPAAVTSRLEAIAGVSRDLGVPVYLVGGLVRDLLLERENRDLDLVVEGDGIAFAEALAQRLEGRLRVHRAFLTAVVIDAEGFHIDIATARSEQYRAPAALPEVQTSALRQDLFRRDFTINTLAIRLGPEPAPELIDYFAGRHDLKEKSLRVLHSLSFIDDPTRVLRGVRLELRLNFRMSPETLHLAQVALSEGVFDQLSGSRLRDELALLLDDPDLALRGLARLAELGVLRAVDPSIELDGVASERLRNARSAHDWYRLEGIADPPVQAWRLLLMALAARFEAEALVRLADRLLLVGEDRSLITGFPARLASARTISLSEREVLPHQVAESLEPLAGEELLLLMAEEDEALRTWVRRYLTELRSLKLGIRGFDLLAAGCSPGPRIGEALRATLRARLDGRIGEAEELGYALAFLAGKPVAVLREETV
jgi:tRNA nucleotidyltransferase (CCA-adding enzyme)